MHAVTAETFGMAELQSRKASPVHICCASALKAKLEVDAAQRPAAKATVNAAWRIVFCENEIMTGPLCIPTLDNQDRFQDAVVGKRLRLRRSAKWFRGYWSTKPLHGIEIGRKMRAEGVKNGRYGRVIAAALVLESPSGLESKSRYGRNSTCRFRADFMGVLPA
jgi:hypothetical protein